MPKKQDRAPEDETIVNKVLQKKYGGGTNAIEWQCTEEEVAKFLRESDLAKGISEDDRARFMEYVMHPNRVSLPIESIMIEALGIKRLIRLGERIEGKVPSPDFASMSDEEFERLQMKIRKGK